MKTSSSPLCHAALEERNFKPRQCYCSSALFWSKYTPLHPSPNVNCVRMEEFSLMVYSGHFSQVEVKTQHKTLVLLKQTLLGEMSLGLDVGLEALQGLWVMFCFLFSWSFPILSHPKFQKVPRLNSLMYRRCSSAIMKNRAIKPVRSEFKRLNFS